MGEAECTIPAVLTNGNGTSTAVHAALLDTGANDFVLDSFLLSLDPHRSLFVYSPMETTLGNLSKFKSNYMVTLYIQLPPLRVSASTHVDITSPTLTINAVVTDELPFPLVIGNDTIHQWNLYDWIRQSNKDHVEASQLRRLLTNQDPDPRDPDDLDNHSSQGDYPPPIFPTDFDDAKSILTEITYKSHQSSPTPSVDTTRSNVTNATEFHRPLDPLPQAVGEHALPLSAANIAKHVQQTLNAARSRDQPYVEDVSSIDDTETVYSTVTGDSSDSSSD
jgi:hypothetical protein